MVKPLKFMRQYLAFLFFCILITQAIQVQATPSDRLQIQATNGLLSIQASNVSALELAEALSKALDVPILLAGDREALINVDVDRAPLEKALSMISPNNLIMRETAAADSAIIEVLLLIDERSTAASIAANPTSLSDDDYQQLSVQTNLEDGSLTPSPAVAADSTLDNYSPNNDEQLSIDAITGMPGPMAFDPVSGEPIDPTTGLPVDPETGLAIDPVSGLPIDPLTGLPIQ